VYILTFTDAHARAHTHSQTQPNISMIRCHNYSNIRKDEVSCCDDAHWHYDDEDCNEDNDEDDEDIGPNE